MERTYDVIGRQGFVDQLLQITDTLSKKKKTECFAINGAWGVGKSYVLDMVEEQMERVYQDGTTLSRYIVFRYNCWEYDYYEEPLIAIVSSILEQLDSKEHFLPEEKREQIKAFLLEAGKGLLKTAVKMLAAELEGPLSTIINSVAGEIKIPENDSFDQYLEFKKKLKDLKKAISALSEYQSVVIIVDELDRCLPDYAIKVLERLHHLFEGVSNIQVILAVDKTQLEQIVKSIYGEKTDAGKYLRKFIRFELPLDCGNINEEFDANFERYTSKFKNICVNPKAYQVDDFKSMILTGLDMRRRVTIIDKCELLHELVAGGQVLDQTYMCLELFLVLLNETGIDEELAKDHFKINTVFSAKSMVGVGAEEASIPQGLRHLAEKYRDNQTEDGVGKYYHADERTYSKYIYVNCLLGQLLAVYRRIIGIDSDNWLYDKERMQAFAEYGLRFWKTLRFLR